MNEDEIRMNIIDFSDGDTSSLCRQVERLRRENIRLTAESTVLKKYVLPSIDNWLSSLIQLIFRDLEGKESEGRRAVLEIEGQLMAVSTQVSHSCSFF